MHRSAWCSVVSLVLCGCRTGGIHPGPTAGAGPPPRPTVHLALNWFPEAEHGGYYAAVVHGLYREAGVDVEILKGGPDAPVAPRVAAGHVAFGVSSADNVLLARAEGAPIVCVMAPLQHSPRCIIVHAASGIDRLEDLRDLTLAMSVKNPFSHYLRKRVPLTGVTIVPYAGNVAPFLLDPDYAIQGYVFSEPFVIRQKGGDPRALMVSDLGFDPYTSVLIASEKTIREEPELVRAVVRASVRGWERYLEDPDATHAEIHRLNPEMSLEVLEFGRQALKPLVLDEYARGHGVGAMSSRRWAGLATQLAECELLKPGQVDPETAYTSRFLPDSRP